MTDDPEAMFRKALAELKDATAKVETIRDIIAEANDAFRYWKTQVLPINADEWVTAQQIQNAILTWNTARRKVEIVHNALPEPMRSAVSINP